MKNKKKKNNPDGIVEAEIDLNKVRGVGIEKLKHGNRK
jgi:hypothetical protein